MTYLNRELPPYEYNSNANIGRIFLWAAENNKLQALVNYIHFECESAGEPVCADSVAFIVDDLETIKSILNG